MSRSGSRWPELLDLLANPTSKSTLSRVAGKTLKILVTEEYKSHRTNFQCSHHNAPLNACLVKYLKNDMNTLAQQPALCVRQNHFVLAYSSLYVMRAHFVNSTDYHTINPFLSLSSVNGSSMEADE
jgi:hypothetical protein